LRRLIFGFVTSFLGAIVKREGRRGWLDEKLGWWSRNS
jgi:hypothetical protein